MDTVEKKYESIAVRDQHEVALTAAWRQAVQQLYPDALTTTYCVPPVHFNRVPYAKGIVPGTNHPTLVVQEDDSLAKVVDTAGGGSHLLQDSRSDADVDQRSNTASAHGNLTEGRVSSNSRNLNIHTTPMLIDENPSTTIPATTQSMPGTAPGNADLPYSLWPLEPQPGAAAKQQLVQNSDMQEDFAQNHVMVNINALAKKYSEVMFVLSEFSFANYLKKLSSDSDPTFPKPMDLGEKYKRGDFDIWIIHRLRGVLVGEFKSVGFSRSDLSVSPQDLKTVIARRLHKAVVQLDKSAAVTRHILQGLAPHLTVQKTIVLPYVSSQLLREVLGENPELEQTVRQSVGVADGQCPVELCVCSDHLSHPDRYWEVSDNTLNRLKAWWDRRMPRSTHPQLDESVYLDIIARFVGPATSVEVHSNLQPRVEIRTESEAVAELGQRLARLVLTRQQVDLLHRPPSMVCLSGPPGTGKTLMLVQMGVKWCLQGHDVHVVSTRHDSLAASYVIQHQIAMTTTYLTGGCWPTGTVHVHNFDTYNREGDLDKAIRSLTLLSEGRPLRVLMDEAKFTDSPTSPKLHRLITELSGAVADLSMWTASLANIDIPNQLQTCTLTLPLRCAPVVQREIHPAIGRFKIQEYSGGGVPWPGEGLPPIRLLHWGKGHSGQWPVDCVQCGHDVATELRRLRVGVEGSTQAGGPSPLQYRDVLILTRSSELQEESRDDEGQVVQRASGVVLGLRDAGLTVAVLEDVPRDRARWEEVLRDTALASTDRVTVSYHGAVSGLERRVVVWLRGRRQGHDDGSDHALVEARERLYVVSRCTTQLVVVDVPQ